MFAAEGVVADEAGAADPEEDHLPKRRRIDEDSAVVPAEGDMERSDDLICFRVLKRRPGGMKSLST